MSGGPMSPASATAAPDAPPKREPNTTEKFTTFGPGRNCESAKASLNSSAVIQPFCSTILRRAHGKAPPKPEIETIAKARNSSDKAGRFAADKEVSGCERVESDMRRRVTSCRRRRLGGDMQNTLAEHLALRPRTADDWPHTRLWGGAPCSG